VWLAGRELELRPKEFDLLALLIAEAGWAVPREQIMAEVWDEHWFGSTKTLDMHIAALRRKLGEQPERPGRITTLRGVGYRLERP
jgi:DNA-binding response OmpR family regulator